MASYSLAGYVYDKDNNNPPSGIVKVQGIFIKRLGSSSPTTYSAVTQTDSFGYYSLNLGDASWLDVTGNWGNNDEVVLIFWMPNSNDRTDDTHTQFADYIHVIDQVGGTNSHFKNVRLMENQGPNCGFNIQSSAERLSSVSTTNTTTDSPHGTNTVAGTDSVRMYQHNQYAGKSVFPVSRRSQSDWDWQWETNGSSTPGVDTESNNNNNLSHVWSTVAEYTIKLKAYDPQAAWCESFKSIRITYRSPTPDFTWHPYPVGVSTDVTFVDTSSDPDNRIGTNGSHPGLSYKWYVDIGSGWVYQNGFDNTDLVRQFASNGDKWIRLEIYWNDGYDDKVSHVDKKITISNTPPVADFDTAAQTKCSVEYVWSSTSYDLDGSIIYYDWNLYELPSGDILSSVGGASQTSFKYAITEIGQYRIVHTVTDNNGANDTKTVDFQVTDIDCGEGSQQQILRTMWTPGAASAATWIKKKPLIKAELISEKDKKQTLKITGGLIDNIDKKSRREKWNSTLIKRSP